MPNLLVIGAITVECTDGRRLPDERGGETVRAYAGNLRSTLTPGKRAWQFTTRPMTVPEQDALRTAAAATTVAVGGTGLGFPAAGTVTCVVEVGEAAFINDVTDTTYGWQAQLPLTVREV